MCLSHLFKVVTNCFTSAYLFHKLLHLVYVLLLLICFTSILLVKVYESNCQSTRQRKLEKYFKQILEIPFSRQKL